MTVTKLELNQQDKTPHWAWCSEHLSTKENITPTVIQLSLPLPLQTTSLKEEGWSELKEQQQQNFTNVLTPKRQVKVWNYEYHKMKQDRYFLLKLPTHTSKPWSKWLRWNFRSKKEWLKIWYYNSNRPGIFFKMIQTVE